MIAALKKMLMIEISAPSTPMLKYRESQYTLAELERRLVAEVSGFNK